MEKLLHVHLQSNMGGKYSLSCYLTDHGSLKYNFWQGWTSSGMSCALSNLGYELPVEKRSEDQTKGQFIFWLKRMISEHSHYKVVKEVKKVEFN